MALEDKIVLGVDLDEVIFEYASGLRSWLAEHRGRTLPPTEPTHWDLVEAGWFSSYEEYTGLHGEAVNNGLYEALALIPGARHHLWDLAKSGYVLNVITSRFVNPGQHQKVVAQTVKALDANRIPYNNISFLDKKVLQHADAYIDDSPRNIGSLKEAGRFIIAYDTLYNRKAEASARATSWDEVREILRERFGR